jgi:quinone-reactive Ni/Fe-hydrogenase small subunit
MGPFEVPLGDRLYHTVFDGLGADAISDKIGIGVLAITGVAVAAHALIATATKEKE